MLKRNDVVCVEMSALDAMVVKSLLGKTSAASRLHSKLEGFLAHNLGCPPQIMDVKVRDRDFNEWCGAQFKDPKQIKINRLEKVIKDAASELASLKGGQ